MRFVFLALLLILPSSAFAQSRVVNDTFREGRESHVQSSTETFQNYQDDGAVMMKERAAAAEEVDAARVQHREQTDESQKQWVDEWTSGADKRAAYSEEDDVMREDRRAASIAAPSEWWGTDIPANANDIDDDYDDMNQ